MSRAFVKEDADAGPPLVPARAPLPPDTPNYVTARGLALLHDELEALTADQRRAESDGQDRSRGLALSTRRGELEARILSAELVDRSGPHPADVRFGATVTVLDASDREHTYTIVGADEADPEHGRIAFFAPLSRALLGRSPGDTAVVRTPRGSESLEIVAVTYDDRTEPRPTP